MSLFDRAFAIVVGEEGGYTNNPADPGNWTGGACGAGALAGTKFGIAASQYAVNVAGLPAEQRALMPTSPADLTIDQAKLIYQARYWAPLAGDALPAPLALLAFDTAVNGGHPAEWIQHAAGVTADGVIGPVTLKAIADAATAPEGGAKLCAEFLAWRLAYDASLPTWPIFGAEYGQPKGWARRICMLPYLSLTMEA